MFSVSAVIAPSTHTGSLCHVLFSSSLQGCPGLADVPGRSSSLCSLLVLAALARSRALGLDEGKALAASRLVVQGTRQDKDKKSSQEGPKQGQRGEKAAAPFRRALPGCHHEAREGKGRAAWALG